MNISCNALAASRRLGRKHSREITRLCWLLSGVICSHHNVKIIIVTIIIVNSLEMRIEHAPSLDAKVYVTCEDLLISWSYCVIISGHLYIIITIIMLLGAWRSLRCRSDYYFITARQTIYYHPIAVVS